MGGDSDARRRLGVEAEAPATTAAPPLDPAEAASRLAYIGQWMRNGAYYIDQVEQEKDVAATVAGADALEQNQALRDQHATLEAHAAELHDLLERSIRFTNRDEYGNCLKCKQPAKELRHRHCWQCGERKPDHADDCRLAAVLAAPPPQRGRQLLDKVERLEAVAEAAAEFAGPVDRGYHLDGCQPDYVDEPEHCYPSCPQPRLRAALDAFDQGETQEADR